MIIGNGKIDDFGPLQYFFTTIQKDPRVGAVHVAVYMALYYKWLSLSCPDFIVAHAYEVMPVARIFSRWTYYQVIRALSEYGYIRYLSTRHKLRGSKVYLNVEVLQ